MIDVRIPFDVDRGKLGDCYNKAMETVNDWALFLDHDTFLINPHWYTLCLKAINALGDKAGWISCRTNAIACPHQLCPETQGFRHDLDKHLDYALIREKTYAGKYTDVTSTSKHLSGLFILTYKKAWKDAGGFMKGFLGVDNQYHRSLAKAGYKVYVAEDIYCYHGYRRSWK